MANPYKVERYSGADKVIRIDADGIEVRVEHDDCDHIEAEARAKQIAMLPLLIESVRTQRGQVAMIQKLDAIDAEAALARTAREQEDSEPEDSDE